MESNLSRDHIALEAMKIILDKSLKQSIPPVERIKRLFGLEYRIKTFNIHTANNIVKAAYEIADEMIAVREKGGKQ